MTGEQVAAQFRLQMDDTSDLSTDEELAVLNRARRRVLSAQDWGFLLRDATGTLSAVNQYVSLPADFSHLPITSNGQRELGRWLYVGAQRDPYSVVPFRDKEAYRGSKNVAYIDRYNGRLSFQGAQDGVQYEFPYVSAPADMASLSEDVGIPSRFADALVYGMATDSWVIQQADKARSYLAENVALYDDAVRRLANWNAMDFS